MKVREKPKAAEQRPARRSRRILRRVGWGLVTLGVIVLLFVLYQLFVTDVITNRIQDDLRQELATEGIQGPPDRPIPGEALGIIKIPKIDLDMAFVEGVGHEELKKGPGHYPRTDMPGKGDRFDEQNNVGIAGHRTTYAKPFWALDELERGDRITLFTRRGRFDYEVRWQRVVLPGQVEVLDPTKKPSLTLTTCNPRFSARERLIIRAVQVGEVGSASSEIAGAP